MIHQPKSLPKSKLHDFFNKHNFLTQFNYDTDGFDGLQDEWHIYWKDDTVKDRIKVLIDDPENPFEPKDITPWHQVRVLYFDLNKISHTSFNFFAYEDYENPELVYFHPATYYYGNYIKDYVDSLINEEPLKLSFLDWCISLKEAGDNFAMHNYKIDMETVSKYNLMK